MRSFYATLTLTVILFVPFTLRSQQIPAGDSMTVRAFNLSSFPAEPVAEDNDPELLSLVPDAYHSHPEFGKLPAGVGFDSVIELIDRRTEYTRTLVKKGTHGKEIYIQQGYWPLHYLDASGWWRTIDETLHPILSGTGIFAATNQIAPTKIDAVSHFASVKNGNNELKFNENLLLYHEDAAGNRTLIATADWSNYTAGAEGVRVTDIWPGIDMEMIVSNGKIKTNYLVKTPMIYADGWLVIEDHPVMPAGESPRFTSNIFDQDGLNFSSIDVQDAAHISPFTMSPAYGFDQSHDPAQTRPFGYKLGVNNEWDLYVPVSWTGNSALQFPLVIDPLVTSSATTLQASITGSYQEPGGLFTNSCNYNMNVPTPANCQITDVLWSFNYIAQNGAALCNGAVTYVVNGCNSPNAAGFYWFCNNCIFAGTCTGTNVSLWSDVSTCIPAPQCASYNIPCTLKFYARGVPAGACSNFYIGANSNWVMTIQGQTVAHPSPPASSNGTTICLGSNTTLTATGQWGVPPYTYLWAPGGQTTQSIVVAPTTTTTYSCTITDACGNTAMNSVTITVNTTATLSPAPTLTYSMSPASGNPCPVTVTFCTNAGNNYGGGSENFQWNFGGGSVTSGGATSGSASGPTYGGAGSSAACGSGPFYTVVYNSAGSYYPSISIFKTGQCAVTTATLTICGALPVELISFDGEYNGQGEVNLHWSTATENNNSYFTIERTTDGVTYELIGTVNTKPAGGNSLYQLNYDFVDEHPVLGGTAYYRLKQTDINGNEETFRMVSITISETNFGFFVHPNPTQDNSTVNFYSEGEHTAVIRIIDYTGRVVQTSEMHSIDGANVVVLDLSELSKGLYLVQVDNGESHMSTRLVKSK